ncbi:MAG: DNA-directed RNA polymerase subunit D, partial [Candidatus Altiarchaeota archaeon]
MNVTKMKKDGERISFTVTGITPQIANALRRAVISEINAMAIDEVTFLDNNSILNDEVLAHRLGLLPLKTDLKTYNMVQDCTCKGKGCAKCSCAITLDVQGPKTVYAGDLKSKDPKVVPVHPKT